MKLITIIGMRYMPKVDLVHALAKYYSTLGQSVTLLDNTEKPIALNITQKQRFVGGCVCCSLASSLIPTVWKLESDVAILATSASADPDTLNHLLQTVQNTRIQAFTIALIDQYTQANHPYLAQKMLVYANLALKEPFDFESILLDHLPH
jgi:hypothetical protein